MAVTVEPLGTLLAVGSFVLLAVGSLATAFALVALRHRILIPRVRTPLSRARRAADLELLRSPLPSFGVAWRVAELVGAKRRLALASSLRRFVRDVPPHTSGDQVVGPHAVGAASQDLIVIADRLADLDRPVAPCGVLLVEQLLTDKTGSPLYTRSRPGALDLYLDATRAALELP
jgi:hypothetical protein